MPAVSEDRRGNMRVKARAAAPAASGAIWREEPDLLGVWGTCVLVAMLPETLTADHGTIQEWVHSRLILWCFGVCVCMWREVGLGNNDKPWKILITICHN